MPAPRLSLDHLVVSARTLEEGVQYVAAALGVEPAGGGAHPLMGTHNRLLGLWGTTYLEVIAIDPAAPAAAPRPRFFSLDDTATHARLANGPYLSHWVVRVEPPKNLERWHAQYPQHIANVVPMTRGDLTWSLTVSQDGAFPAWQGAGDGVLPSLIQWDTPHHPSQRLTETGIALKSLSGFHPQADTVRAQLEWLGAAHLIDVQQADAPALVAEFETPSGVRKLGA